MHDRTRISCADVADLLPAIADGQLDAEQAPDIFAHLATCSACQESLALHDLCSLAVAGDRLPAREPAAVTHYHVPAWLSLPLAAAAGLAVVVLLRGLGGPASSSETLADAAQPKRVEILHVLPAGPDHPHPRYLVRIGGSEGETRWVDPSQLDDTIRNNGELPFQERVPVGFQRP